eukprot:2146102-Pyramimonas_sp.AAC.1
MARSICARPLRLLGDNAPADECRSLKKNVVATRASPRGNGRKLLHGIVTCKVSSSNSSEKTKGKSSKVSLNAADGPEMRKNTNLYSELQVARGAAGRKLLKKPEVLAPAGGWDQVRAAVESGADAVYFGLADLNARARAANFDPGEELCELMEYLHHNGVKGYVTMNVLVFNNELKTVEERARQMARAGVDAVIVQDLGVVEVIRNVAPNLPIHGSTQMTITSAEGVEFAAKQGVTRVVVGRELSVQEIGKISSAATGMKLPLHPAPLFRSLVRSH